jgi:hypothetical protein
MAIPKCYTDQHAAFYVRKRTQLKHVKWNTKGCYTLYENGPLQQPSSLTRTNVGLFNFIEKIDKCLTNSSNHLKKLLKTNAF